MESLSSSSDMKMHGSPFLRPSTRNWSPNVVLPVPNEPMTTAMWPSGNPPCSISSRPTIPVLTLLTATMPHPTRSVLMTTNPLCEVISVAKRAMRSWSRCGRTLMNFST